MKFVLWVFLVIPALGVAGELTWTELLKDSKIPLKREFPLSLKVKPCEDFHRYVCEEAEKSFQLPSDRARWIFAFNDSSERLLYARKAYFKKLTQGLEPKLARTHNVRRLYEACMNVDAKKREERAFVQARVERLQSAKDLPALRALVNENLLTPEAFLVQAWGEANQSDSTVHDLVISVGAMTLPEKSAYQDPAAVEDLRRVAEALFRELKLDKAKERAAAVVDFEKSFAAFYLTPNELRQRFSADSYWPRERMLSTYPNLDLARIFKQAPSSAKVRNFTPDALAFVDRYLAEAPPFNLQSWMTFAQMLDLMDDAYPKFYQALHEFRRKRHGGPPVREPRDERCAGEALALSKELDAEMIAAVYPNFDGGPVREMAESARQTLLAQLKRNTWLSESARQAAIKKITAASLSLIKPASEKDWDFLAVEGLSADQPINNRLALGRAGIAQMLRKIREPRNRSEWSAGPLTVNAFYAAEDNRFSLPLGILQPPFFDSKQSRVENLAAMGMVVGHELGHAVDDEGSKYDEKGNVRKWMTEADLRAFKERGAKLVEQFKRAGHDGELTLGENIGDSVGIKASLETAFPKLEEAPVEDLRKFFVSYARLWCYVIRPEAKKQYLKTNAHSLPDARINLQVAHKDAFYKAFACKAGDKMYLKPEDRVEIW